MIRFLILSVFLLVSACGNETQTSTNSSTALLNSTLNTISGSQPKTPVDSTSTTEPAAQVPPAPPTPDPKQICTETLASKIKSYEAFMAKKEYDPALLEIQPCAKLLDTPELKKLVANTEILLYSSNIENTKEKVYIRARNYGFLKTDYPEAAKKYEKLGSELEAIQNSKWNYSSGEDEMSSDKIYSAVVQSNNFANFDFPYEGNQYARLSLRIHPRYGKDVIFRIDEGQIQCNSYSGCSVLVRFDDKKAVRYSAAESSDNNPKIIFIRDYNKFVENMRNSKTVKISAEIYHEGNPVFEFDVSGFDTSEYPLGKSKK